MDPRVLAAFAAELTKLGKAPKYIEDLQPGDVISIETGKPRSMITKAFAKGTQAWQGSFTHSGIYVGDGKVVESLMSKGVVMRDFNDALRNKSFLVHRPKVSKRERKKAAAFAKKQVGKDYDTVALVVTAAGKTLPGPITKLIDKKILKPPKNSDKYLCSHLVQAAYKTPLTESGMIAPVDLRKSDKLKLVKAVEKGDFQEKAPLLPTTRWGWGKRERPDKSRLIKR